MHQHLSLILLEFQSQLKLLYGKRFHQVILYGSQARKTADVGSDIDVLVVLNDQVEPVMEIMRVSEMKAATSLKYNVVISCSFMSLQQFLEDSNSFLLNIKNEGVLV